MLIEIRCRNYSDFDTSLGKYVECGESIFVSSDQVGEQVTCTKCQQRVEVPYDLMDQTPQTTAKQSDGEEAKSTKTGGTSSSRPGKRSKPARETSQPRRSEKQRSSSTNRSTVPPTGDTAAEPRRARKTDSQPERLSSNRGDLMAKDFAATPPQSELVNDRQDRCKKCGNLSVNSKCTVCHHVESKFEKLYAPLDEIEIEIAGFQLWFCRTMAEGISISVLAWVSHLLVGMLGLALLSAAIVGLFGIGMGVTGGIILLLIVGSSWLLYISLVFKGHQFVKNPRAKLAWFQRPAWNLMLTLARAMKWEHYDSSLKNRRIIQNQDRGFVDAQIRSLPGVKNCQVLDLERTQVTDSGLLDLYDMKHLACVVLKRTQVTHEGVFRLQQSFPRLWIWY
ncbi:MAG: hypothetical protein ACI87E_002486 [Mariniblastus sp.]|jgi:hypothetical protein